MRIFSTKRLRLTEAFRSFGFLCHVMLQPRNFRSHGLATPLLDALTSNFSLRSRNEVAAYITPQSIALSACVKCGVEPEVNDH